MADLVVYPYIVVMQYTHPRDGSKVEQSVSVEAYSMADAIMQASVEVEAKFAYMEQQYAQKLIWVGPDVKKASERVSNLLKDIGLLKMPTGEKKQ